MSIDPKFVKLAADLEIFLLKGTYWRAYTVYPSMILIIL